MFQKISDSKNECPGGIAQVVLGGNARIGHSLALPNSWLFHG